MRVLLDDDLDVVRTGVKRRLQQRGGQIGPYSKLIDRGAIGGAIDGRSREGRFLRAFEAMLVEHLGHPPSITQRVIISRAARTALHLELLDEQSFGLGKPLTQHAYQHYN